MQIVVQALIRRVFAHKPRPLGRGGWLPKQIHDIPAFNQDITDVLNQVYSEYGHYTDIELESLIHQSTPWQNARQGLKPLDRSTHTFNDQDLLTWFIPMED